MSQVSYGHFILNVLAAMLGGLIIGYERELKGKSAGLKTNAIVAIGACVFVMVSFRFMDSQNADMTRVLSQVVAGVGFLGAGVILQRENKAIIHGLTTAATIWCSAAVGCLAAVEMYLELATLSILLVALNWFVSKLGVKKRLHGEEGQPQMFDDES